MPDTPDLQAIRSRYEYSHVAPVSFSELEACRSDIPDLLAYVERIESELARVTLEREACIAFLKNIPTWDGVLGHYRDNVAAFLSRLDQPQEPKA